MISEHECFPHPENKDISIWRYMDFFTNMPDSQLQEIFSSREKFNKEIVKTFFASCWHMNEHESAAMWQLYSKSNESICIKSTFQKIHDLLPSWIYVGEINYIDYDTEPIPEMNLFWPILHKRKSFVHERELRAIAWESQINAQGISPIQSKITET